MFQPEWLNSVRKRSLSLAIVRTYNFVMGNASISAYLTILPLRRVTRPPTVTRPTFKSFTRVGYCRHLNPTDLSPIRTGGRLSQPETRPVYRPIGRVPGRTELGSARLPILIVTQH